MTPDETLLRLGPRIKLLKRHVQEWVALLKHQKQVLHLTKEETKQHRSTHPDDKLALPQQLAEKGIRLHQLSIRQSEERKEMKTRHHQEEAELEQALNSYK